MSYTGYITPATGAVSAVDPVFPSAGGQPVLKAYNPKRYSGRFLRKFYEACVLTHISNTDYEGEIKDYGDSVIIRTTPDIQIYDYENGQNLNYDTYSTDVVTLDIDRGKYWAFVTRRVDMKQTDLKKFVEAWTSDAAERMKIVIETEVYSEVYADANAYNAGETAGKKSGLFDLGSATAPLTISKTNLVQFVTDCGTVLDEQDIPGSERWMIMPMWMGNKAVNSDLVKANEMGDGKSILRGAGQDNIGMIDRFTVYRSNCLYDSTFANAGGTPTNVAYTNLIFGHKSALTFAAQLTENESLPNPNGFGTLHRGLKVYGYKVVLPVALGHACVTSTSYTTA